MMKYKILSLTNLFIFITIIGVGWITATVISPVLHYHLQHTAFLTGTDFFKSYSAYPGGISDYLAQFIAQFFNFNLPGSILIVSVASFQGFLAIAIAKQLQFNIKYSYVIFTLVLIFGVTVLFNYYYPYYASVRLLLTFLFTWGFCILNKKYPDLSAIVWFIFSGLLFYLSGGFAMFIFAGSSIFIFIQTNKKPVRYLYIPAFLIFAALLPFVAYKTVCSMGLENLYKITLFKPPAMLAYTPDFSIYTYYFILPVFLLLILLFNKLQKSKSIHTKTSNHKTSWQRVLSQPIFLLSSQVIFCFFLGYILVLTLHDSSKKNLLYIDFYAEHHQWDEVLKTAEKVNTYDFRVNFQVNRAYAQFGQLPDRLFEYPQLLGSKGLFIDALLANSAAMLNSDLYFDFGFMDESQHWAYEAQTLLPDSPRILKRLIMINLVSQKYDMAGKFLDILDKNMLYRDWVRKYKQYVSDTTLAASDKLIVEKRSLNPQTDAIDNGDVEWLKLLVETNKDNKLAYDYLMSYLILDSNYSEFLRYLKLYSHFGLKSLPLSWEETLIFYVASRKTSPENIPIEIISKKTIQRFSDFTKLIAPYKNNLQEAKNLSAQNYSTSYWYYLLYLNPKVTKVLEQKIPVK